MVLSEIWSDPDTRRIFVAAVLLVAVLAASVLLYVFRPSPQVQRILFFPDETSGEWLGELRELPKQETTEAEIEYVMRELILGPTTLEKGRVLPRETEIGPLLLRDDVLYVGFSEHLVFPTGDMAVDFDGMLEGVKRTIEYNYRSIGRVRFFVGGVEVAS